MACSIKKLVVKNWHMYTHCVHACSAALYPKSCLHICTVIMHACTLLYHCKKKPYDSRKMCAYHSASCTSDSISVKSHSILLQYGIFHLAAFQHRIHGTFLAITCIRGFVCLHCTIIIMSQCNG